MNRGIITMEKMKMRSPDMTEENATFVPELRPSLTNRKPGYAYGNPDQTFKHLFTNTNMKLN